MLFVAFVACLWLAVRLGRREGFAKELVQDIAVWVLIVHTLVTACVPAPTTSPWIGAGILATYRRCAA
jgi:hypothetical protein